MSDLKSLCLNQLPPLLCLSFPSGRKLVKKMVNKGLLLTQIQIRIQLSILFPLFTNGSIFILLSEALSLESLLAYSTIVYAIEIQFTLNVYPELEKT